MQDSAPQSSPRSQLIGQLSDVLDMPILAIVSGWHGQNVVNLGDEAVRAFIEVLDDELEDADTDVDTIGLFLMGRGGFPLFAEGVWRALSGRGISATALVPYLSLIHI